ncbi:ferritin-like domain-containing protein [Streptomyces sp. NPDC004838]
MKVLIVLTSHDQLGATGRKTGFWLEELAAPYYRFKDAGADIVLASPKGGRPPLDPKSNEPGFQTDDTRRFESDPDATAALARTVRLDTVSADDFDAVFYPGGHGPLWDLAEDQHSIRLIETTLRAGKPLALVCHAPGVLRHATGSDGAPLVQGRRVTGFTNEEEAAVGLTDVVPFLVEDELTRLGGDYSKAGDWEPYVLTDGLLVTGQNPASSAPAADALLALAARTAAPSTPAQERLRGDAGNSNRRGETEPVAGFTASPQLAEALQQVLADLVELSLQGKQAHWNIVGPNFRDLHLQLDEIVDTAREYSDTVAERMRALGAAPDARTDTVAATTTLPVFPAGVQDSTTVVDLVTTRLNATAHTARTVHGGVDAEDPTTADILNEIIGALEKQAWMLREEIRKPA